MQIWQLLQQDNTLVLVLFAVVGLIVGSFLNVVIYRSPLIMFQQWRAGSVQLLQSQPDIAPSLVRPIASIVTKDTPLSLSSPASHCPSCTHPIKWYENIPLLSWLILKGKCSHCQQAISWRYPIVELSTALLTVLVVYTMGLQLPTLFALLFVWTLIALAGIDFDTQYLPDKLTFPLAGLGLAVNTQSWFVSPTQSIWGLIVGYLILWIVVQIFYLITKKQGMGQGDFKLLAALGAWLGPWMLPFIILLSSLLGSIIGLILMYKANKSQPFAFGPYLAIAGIVTLLYGPAITQWYLDLY